MSAPVSGAIAGFSFSLETGSVALREASGRIHERVLEGHRSHANDALNALADMMQSLGLSGSDMAAVAADVGPGGFTGLRTACGMAQGLAIGWNVPCVAVSSLDILAHAAARRHAQRCADGAFIVSALDARQNEVYTAIWQMTPGGGLQKFGGPLLLPYGSQPPVPAGPCLAVGPGVVHLVFGGPHAPCPSAAAFTQASGSAATGPVVAKAETGSADRSLLLIDETLIPAAGDLLQVAAGKIATGDVVEPAQCQPLYVRDQVALTTAERRAKAGA